ncbi:hypothetical protein CHS0354_003741 [Potamilus streckersoni]|uniref:Uncharacterized protein n=1 Tax=Potamilus streckersoni TaxID=2493646 RepID=A0AAE0SP39_9BIVA|nr:hypothetical protein CHS0354_003741 [Potamilus streckersoni]
MAHIPALGTSAARGKGANHMWTEVFFFYRRKTGNSCRCPLWTTPLHIVKYRFATYVFGQVGFSHILFYNCIDYSIPPINNMHRSTMIQHLLLSNVTTFILLNLK